jgi:hypothetical protein
MPSDHRFRFDDQQGRSPASPELPEPNPQKSVSKAQARSVAAARSLQYEEAESQDLCMEHGSVPKTLPNRGEKTIVSMASKSYSCLRSSSTGSMRTEFLVGTS